MRQARRRGRARAANIATIALTACPANMSTTNQATAPRVAAASWSPWACGCARVASGPSSTGAVAAGNSTRTAWAADDNPMKLMSIALKPLTQPPFPTDRIEELTDLMGGEGSLGAYGKR